jgi:hypothetical protein
MTKFKWRKPEKKKPYTEQKNAEGEEKPEDTQIVIGRRIEIDFVNDLRKQHKTEHDEETAHNKKQLRWTKIAAGVVFIYTAIMAIQAWLMWESFVSVQRAFVSGQFEPTISRVFDPARNIYVALLVSRMGWMNGGTTPGVHALQWVWRGDHEPSEDDFKGTSIPKPAPTFSIGPRAPAYSLNVSFELGDIVDLETGRIKREHRSYVWGWMVYRDVFPFTKPHITEVCQLVDTVGKVDTGNVGNPPTYNTSFIYCAQHNCTDEECSDYNEMMEFTKRK